MLKNWFLKGTACLFFGAMLFSCTEEKLGFDTPVTPPVYDDSHDVTFSYPAYLGNVYSDMRTALNECLTNKQGTIDNSTRLVVLGNLNEIDFPTLLKAYEQGTTIAVVKPDPSEVNAFFASHDELGHHSLNVDINEALIFSFDNNDYYSVVYSPDVLNTEEISYTVEDVEDDEDFDTGKDFEGTPQIIEHSPEYHYIVGWLEALEKRETEGAWSDGATDDDEFKRFARVSVIKQSFPIDMSTKVWKLLPTEHADTIKGHATFTITYNIYQVHVYEGVPDQGNYYLVDADASLANKSAYKGIRKNDHGFAIVKTCGNYCKEFSFTSQLLDSLGRPANVMFTVEGAPTPRTLAGETQYQITSSKSVGFGLSVSGQVGSKKGSLGWSAGGKAEVSANWSWGKSESFSLKDVKLDNDSEDNVAGWTYYYSNLPVHDRKNDNKFDDSKSTTYKSTVSFNCRWVWYDPSGKDNENATRPFIIKTTVKGIYEGMGHVYSQLHRVQTKVSGEKTDSLTYPMVTKTVGLIDLENTFKDLSIFNISVYDAKNSENVYYNDRNSYAPGKTVSLGAYLTDDKNPGQYKVKFDARASGDSETVKYDYSLNDFIPLTTGATTTLNAKVDFSTKK